MFYYKHHIGDYRRDTGHLSLLEHGAYRQLLDLYYVDEKPIPNETDWVMRRLSAKTQVEKDAVLAVLSDFFTQDANGWSHKRCDSEILAYEEKADQNQKNGKLGGRPKKKTGINPEITQSVSNANPTQSENNLNHKPLTINQEPKKKAQAPTASPFVLPEWINKSHWDTWHRGTKRKAATNAQKQLAVDKLTRWRLAGIDHAKALENAAEGNWQGLHEPNGKPSAYTPPSPAITTPSRQAVDPLMSKAIQESMRTLASVDEIHARLQREKKEFA